LDKAGSADICEGGNKISVLIEGDIWGRRQRGYYKLFKKDPLYEEELIS
jgi:hypothetical protein